MPRAALTLLLVGSLLLLPPSPLPAETIAEVLDSGLLKNAYNPVLLDYLLEEGREDLSEEIRQAALDQLVAALKQDIDITPEEQKAAAMMAAGAAMTELLGGSTGSNLGAAAGDATYDVWSGWVDSAVTLERAGYEEEARAFFEKCIQIYPYTDLRGRCALGLASGSPEQSVERLFALTDGNDSGTINAALRILGRLASSDGFPPSTRSEIVTRLTEFTGGLNKASHGLAACDGLVWTRDPAAVPVLQKLAKGMMNADFHRCARRGLLLEFDDRSVVPLLEKSLKGGKFSPSEPWDRFFAASVLMEAGVESGYAWAGAEFAKGSEKKGGSKGFMKKMMGSEEKVDFRPALVNALVGIGDERAKQALHEAFAMAEGGSWLQTWIAIGLLETDDPTYVDLVRGALDRPEWEFTLIRVSTALARHGDDAGVPPLGRLYDKAANGLEPETGRAILEFLGGSGDLYLADRGEREARLIRLRRQIAGAVAEIDSPQSTPILLRTLDDPEDSVRTAAAYGLARMSEGSAVDGLAKAIGVDFGGLGESSRNPTVHAHVVRWTAAHHGTASGAELVFDGAAKSPFASVRFLALSAN